MRSFLSNAIALAMVLVPLACNGSDGPTPVPTPPPDPGPGAFDCTRALGLSGVVEVEDPVPDRYIVVLKPAAAGQRLATSAVRVLGERHGAREIRMFERTLPGFACRAGVDSAAALAADPQVAFVQQVGRKHVAPIEAAQTDATWGLDRTDQRDLPLNGDFNPGASGAGVHLYVIDTGVDVNHPDFSGRVGDGFSAPGGGFLDDNGHGTHVAGTAGGSIFGVAKQVVIHPVRVLVDGSGTDSDVIAGIDWVTEHVRANGWPAVANMSLGGPVSPALDLALCNSIAAGVSYAVAAGNEDADACHSSPSRVFQAVGTGATNRSDARASFSNWGRCVDVFAPGRDITSARRGGGSRTLSGTSMASPHAAGVSALCLERNPGSTPAQVRQCVLDHASRDKLRDIGRGSPNRLLYARDE